MLETLTILVHALFTFILRRPGIFTPEVVVRIVKGWWAPTEDIVTGHRSMLLGVDVAGSIGEIHIRLIGC